VMLAKRRLSLAFRGKLFRQKRPSVILDLVYGSPDVRPFYVFVPINQMVVVVLGQRWC
jgi:hypothetical protein